MDEVPVKIIIRDFIAADDEACIYSTWRNSAFFSASNPSTISPTKFFTNKSREIKDILSKANIKVACLEDSKETIIGYSVSRGTHLDWIYVKPAYRMQGIAALLIPKDMKTVTSDLTKTGEKIVKLKNLKKENEDGRNENR